MMADYTGRNRKRLQRDQRKDAKRGVFHGTDAIMEAYGNKRNTLATSLRSVRQGKNA